MNWDLLIGIITGGSISLINIIGTIISNRQNNKHALEMQKQMIILETSFKAYQHSSEKLLELAEKQGQPATIYPYDMYLISYTRIANHLRKNKLKQKDVAEILKEMREIAEVYREHNDIRK